MGVEGRSETRRVRALRRVAKVAAAIGAAGRVRRCTAAANSEPRVGRYLNQAYVPAAGRNRRGPLQ